MPHPPARTIRGTAAPHGTRRIASRRRARAAAVLVVAVYVGTMALAPLVHAATEVERATVAIEAAHSPLCPTLHAGPQCAATGAQHRPGHEVAAQPIVAAPVEARPGRTAVLHFDPRERRRASPPRAPPTA